MAEFWYSLIDPLLFWQLHIQDNEDEDEDDNKSVAEKWVTYSVLLLAKSRV